MKWEVEKIDIPVHKIGNEEFIKMEDVEKIMSEIDKEATSIYVILSTLDAALKVESQYWESVVIANKGLEILMDTSFRLVRFNRENSIREMQETL